MYLSGSCSNNSAPVTKASVSSSSSGASKNPVPAAMPEANNAEGPYLVNVPGPAAALAAL